MLSLVGGLITVAALGLAASRAPAEPTMRPTEPAPVTHVSMQAGGSPGNTLGSGQRLTTGRSLRSADGRYVLTVTAHGRARLAEGDRPVWQTPPAGPGAALLLRSSGNLVLVIHGRTVWQAGTRGGAGSRLAVGAGEVTVANRYGSVWSSRQGNRCRRSRASHAVRIDLSDQRAWLCSRGQQVLTTAVTTGAVARGNGTPTGTWRVVAKVRNATLRPSAGGTYHVKFWMPYDGSYGLHDSPWQHFPYGSSRYRTQGSHGCVHVPGALMAYLFQWAPVGTTVSVFR